MFNNSELDEYEQKRAERVTRAEFVWAQIQDCSPENAETVIQQALILEWMKQLEALAAQKAAQVWRQFEIAKSFSKYERKEDEQKGCIRAISSAFDTKLGMKE